MASLHPNSNNLGYFINIGIIGFMSLFLIGTYVFTHGIHFSDIRAAEENGKRATKINDPDVSVSHDIWRYKTSLKYEHGLITSIVKRLEAGEIVNPSDPSILKFRAILDSKPKSDIALLIPCVVQHIKYFNQFYQSVLLQTVLPSEVLITFSAITDVSGALPRLLTLLPLPNMNVHLRGGAHSASQNKVYLISQSTKDLYSFFDCDDIMHPQRTEYLVAAFQQCPDMDALVHGMLRYSRKFVPDKYLDTWLGKYAYTTKTMSSFNM